MVQFQPKQPTWYEKPEEVRVRIERVVKSTFFEEYAVLVRTNGTVESVIVPGSAVDETNMTMLAYKIGEYGDEVLLSLPPTSMGGKTLQVKLSKLADLVVA